MAERYVLDAFAFIAYARGEPGEAQVAEILADTTNELHMSMINLGEIAYIVLRRRGATVADELAETLYNQPNLQVAQADWTRVRAAAAIKAAGRMSYADAFAGALAEELGAVLVTGDPEFEPLERAGRIRMCWLARRSST